MTPKKPPSIKVSVRERIRHILHDAEAADGKRQALSVEEIRAEYCRLFNSIPRGLSKHLAALKSDGEITQLNRGVYIWKEATAIYPVTKPYLDRAAALPQRHVQHPAGVDLSIIFATVSGLSHALIRRGIMVSESRVRRAIRNNQIPAIRTNDGHTIYDATALQAAMTIFADALSPL